MKNSQNRPLQYPHFTVNVPDFSKKALADPDIMNKVSSVLASMGSSDNNKEEEFIKDSIKNILKYLKRNLLI